MEDQTTFTPKQPDQSTQQQQPPGESHYKGITVRAWLAIALILAVVLHSVAQIMVVYTLVLEGKIDGKDATAMLAVTEPLYTMAGMCLAYYFGAGGKTGQPLNKISQ